MSIFLQSAEAVPSTNLFPHFIQAVVARDCLAKIIKRKHFNHRALYLSIASKMANAGF